jgi:hypothetical protein
VRVARRDFGDVVNAAPHDLAADGAGLPADVPVALAVADAVAAAGAAPVVPPAVPSAVPSAVAVAGAVGVEDVLDVAAQAGSASAQAATTSADRVDTRRDRMRMGITSGWRGPPVDVRCADRTGSSLSGRLATPTG